MKPHQVNSLVKMYTGMTTVVNKLRIWERMGLIGQVPKHQNAKGEDSSHRDYTSFNVNRILLIVMLRYIGWHLSEIQKLIVNKDSVARERLLSDWENIQTKFVPRFKEIVEDLGSII